jgi:putative endonuclease
MPKFYVYILFSESLQRYYTGSTDDIARRIKEHNKGKSLFTSRGSPWVIKYQQEFGSRDEASQKEKQIKKRGAGRYLKDMGIVD